MSALRAILGCILFSLVDIMEYFEMAGLKHLSDSLQQRSWVGTLVVCHYTLAVHVAVCYFVHIHIDMHDGFLKSLRRSTLSAL